MTTAPLVVDAPTHLAGDGWTAEVYCHRIDLTIDSDLAGDTLVEAINELLSPAVRSYWYVTWQREDEDGNDVYLICRRLQSASSLL